MASTSQQPHPGFSSRNYKNQIKLPSANLVRDQNRIERDRASLGQTGASSFMNSINEEQREEINEAFALFDLDKDLHIDYHEFKVALKALGFDLSKSVIVSHLKTHGTPQPSQALGHGKSTNSTPTSRTLLSLPAFQNIAAKLIAERDPKEEIIRAFKLFDIDDKGMISIEDLRRVSQELGEALDEDELVSMIEEFDLEGKGGVGPDEFLGICMG
ncbi:Centrin-3 [Erysiphe neolycopersici]|uniref:Calmodulin n=1 Tax=Erysiphe neolycopersici TaxID=212602 RepID=A0A420HD73_9PEZI|nr:Centrin-3 [Erysiphe neolycopersici]